MEPEGRAHRGAHLRDGGGGQRPARVLKAEQQWSHQGQRRPHPRRPLSTGILSGSLGGSGGNGIMTMPTWRVLCFQRMWEESVHLSVPGTATTVGRAGMDDRADGCGARSWHYPSCAGQHQSCPVCGHPDRWPCGWEVNELQPTGTAPRPPAGEGVPLPPQAVGPSVAIAEVSGNMQEWVCCSRDIIHWTRTPCSLRSRLRQSQAAQLQLPAHAYLGKQWLAVQV